MDAADRSRLTTAVNIFASPSEAFAAIREAPRPFLPLAVVVVGSALVAFLYLNEVDLGWFLEEQIRTSMEAQGAPEDQIEQAAEAIGNVPPLVMGSLAAMSTVLSLGLIYFLNALYLRVVSLFAGDGFKLGQWFGLVCWCALPLAFGRLASLVNLLASDVTFMPQWQVNPLSFASLLGLEPSGTFETALQSYDPTAIWVLVLMVLGYQAFTRKSLVAAAAIVLGPYVAIIGIGSYFAFA
jgi:hypothetical protein